jgi:hypothetical protein
MNDELDHSEKVDQSSGDDSRSQDPPVTRRELIKTGGAMAAAAAIGATAASDAAAAVTQPLPILPISLPIPKTITVNIKGKLQDLQTEIIKTERKLSSSAGVPSTVLRSQILHAAYSNAVLANAKAMEQPGFTLNFGLNFTLFGWL